MLMCLNKDKSNPGFPDLCNKVQFHLEEVLWKWLILDVNNLLQWKIYFLSMKYSKFITTKNIFQDFIYKYEKYISYIKHSLK